MPTMEQQDYYQILGVDKSANQEQIKHAFRALARRWHPDRCREPNATEMFQQINEAHATLSDPTAKARYDARNSSHPMIDAFTHFVDALLRPQAHWDDPYTQSSARVSVGACAVCRGSGRTHMRQGFFSVTAICLKCKGSGKCAS